MPKFEVSKADENIEDADTETNELNQQEQGIVGDTNDHGAKKNLYLYEEDMKQMPRVATFVKSLVNYHTVHPSEKDAEAKKPKMAQLGVIFGVYLPTIQHIFGVLMFVRLAWIVGSAGVIQSFLMVFLCCLTTFVTAISMSAIATNGMVQAGGSYFMISRNLGPECGGAVGICFYLANTFAVDLYILGAIEIFLQYMAPQLAYFGDIHHNPDNNMRVYGTVTLLILALVVAVGVRFVQMFAPISLACVIISIICVYIGAFQANANTRDVNICMLGNRLLTHKSITANERAWCSKNTSGPIYKNFCGNSTGATPESCEYFQTHNLSYIPGIPGVASGVLAQNAHSHYLNDKEVVRGVEGSSERGEVVSDMAITFVALCAIYFPSVTGIMTGSNMSGDLKDPHKSIPIGTILAQLTCSFVYLSFILLFGATAEGALLRDKFGESLGGSLLVAKLAWPHPWVILVGAFCSTLGAALQCLTSAPRLLQAIARDNIIPFLDVFKVTTKKGEPLRALLLTTIIAEAGILIAKLEGVAPVIDVCFLMCYGFVNLTCALQTLLKTPNWRPRFKYYHWTLSLLGVALNLALSIMAGWYFALAAFAIGAFIYKYVEYKGGEKEWGDSITGLSLSAAQKALLKLDECDPHTKNWRPQVLVLCKINHDLTLKYPRIFSFASQLKAGKGLTVVSAVLEGDFIERAQDAEDAKQILRDVLKEEKVKGFAKILVTKNITEGLNNLVQTIGLGGLRHNTVMVGWPYGWRNSTEERSWKVFLDTVKAVTAKELALLVPRGINSFPSNFERSNGTIDVWWIVHDGGMLILLSFLLQQHKVWKQCKIRIFTVAQMTDNSIQLKKDLQTFLYQLRISAEVFVEEMYDNDISAYTVERTLDMEKRAEMLRELHMSKQKTMVPRRTSRPSLTQNIVQHSRRRTSLTALQTPAITIQEIVDSSHLAKLSDSPTTKRKEGGEGKTRRESLREKFRASRSTSKTEKSEDSIKIEMDTLKLPPSGTSNLNPTEDSEDDQNKIHFTFSPGELEEIQQKMSTQKLSDHEGKLMRMHTAIKLNEAIRSKSGDAKLVIINFPAPPAKLSAEENYMEYLEALTEGLDRVLMVRGSGKEVVTIYS